MNLAIVGLDKVGTAIGIALRSAVPEISIMGHDPDAQRVARAKRLGAIDKSHWNLPAACEQAEIVLLDLPLAEIEKTVLAMKQDLQAGALVLDTTPLKRPVFACIEPILPPSAEFVGGHVVPIEWLAPDEDPPVGWLKDAVFYLVASEKTSDRALDLAASLASAVGAKPRFIEAAEHDGLVAGTQLPLLSAATLMAQAQRTPGWRERVHLMSPAYDGVELALQQAGEAGESLLHNADYLLPWLDEYLQELLALRNILANENTEALAALLKTAQEARRDWHQRARESEQAIDQGDLPNWRDMLLGNMARRRPR